LLIFSTISRNLRGGKDSDALGAFAEGSIPFDDKQIVSSAKQGHSRISMIDQTVARHRDVMQTSPATDR